MLGKKNAERRYAPFSLETQTLVVRLAVKLVARLSNPKISLEVHTVCLTSKFHEYGQKCYT